MDKQKEQLDTLRDIRSLMERSSRFLSLSGLSGVVSGMAAIAGVAAAYFYLGLSPGDSGYYQYAFASARGGHPEISKFLLADSIIVLLVALLSASLLTRRKAKQHGWPVWDITAKRMLINLMIPLITGGCFCLALLYHDQPSLLAPATLIFYGLALLNASKYTLNDLRFLGMLEIITGLVASVEIEHGLLFWAFGFGILHIVYGVSMYFKYER